MSRPKAAFDRLGASLPVGRRSVLVSLLAATALAPGCDGGDGAAGERDFLVVDAPHPLSFEPSTNGRLFTQLGVAETLVEADDEGALHPGLATSWSESGDGLEWRFSLRDGAQFHDGSAVTPTAVVAALERARGRPGVFKFVEVDRIGEDAGQLVIRLRARSALLPAVLAHFANQIRASGSYDAAGRAVAAIGSGPYRIRAGTEQELWLDHWHGWAGPRPQVQRVRYLSAGRAETRGALAESGQADLVIGLDMSSQARLRGRAGVRVLTAFGPRTIFLKVNAGHDFLKDVRARRALSLAIDRIGIAAGLLQAPDRAASQLLPPSLAGWRQDGLAPLRTDPAEAAALLAGLGWRLGPDGVLVRDGRRLALTLLCHSATPELPLIAAAIQAQCRGVGIEIAVKTGSTAQTPAGHNDGTLELALINRSFMLIPDPVGTLLEDFADGGGEFGAMNWSHPAVESALRELAAGADAERGATLRSEIVGILHAELPVIPVVYNPRTAAANSRIVNATVDPLERSYGIARIGWRSG